MGELVNRQICFCTRKQFLCGVSALALAAYIGEYAPANAEVTSRPTVWIELGGQMEMMQGTYSEFTAPFMSVTPEPGSYGNSIFASGQNPARSAFGLEGSLTLQPQSSNWKFSAAIRYGRGRAKHHDHQQGAVHSAYKYNLLNGSKAKFPLGAAAFADVKDSFRESHMVLDFDVGKDVGIGLLGKYGTTTFNAGVRFAQFSTQSDVTLTARPKVTAVYERAFIFSVPYTQFNNYALSGHAQRNFRGVGPSLSWNGSAGILGNAEEGELMLDWGVNGALLFGRQKAKMNHATNAYEFSAYRPISQRTLALYPARNHHDTRSRSVVVPNIGGFAGFSVRYPNVKISVGYRADFFFGAVDAGIDERRTKDLGFQGPFATVSIGLGG